MLLQVMRGMKIIIVWCVFTNDHINWWRTLGNVLANFLSFMMTWKLYWLNFFVVRVISLLGTNEDSSCWLSYKHNRFLAWRSPRRSTTNATSVVNVLRCHIVSEDNHACVLCASPRCSLRAQQRIWSLQTSLLFMTCCCSVSRVPVCFTRDRGGVLKMPELTRSWVLDKILLVKFFFFTGSIRTGHSGEKINQSLEVLQIWNCVMKCMLTQPSPGQDYIPPPSVAGNPRDSELSMLSGWKRWYTVSPVNHRGTSQSQASMSWCMQKWKDSAFSRICHTVPWWRMSSSFKRHVWLHVSLRKHVTAFIFPDW